MNNRVFFSIALAAGGTLGIIFSHTLPQAQAQSKPQAQSGGIPSYQSLQAKIKRMQSQIDTLQAQVKQLQEKQLIANLHTSVSPFYQAPIYQLPMDQVPTFHSPIYQAPKPPRLSNIPDSRVILLRQVSH